MDSAVFERLGTLAEPLRVRLLHLLAREELAVGELSRVLQTPQSTVSRHLKLLDAGGWVARRRVGTATYFRMLDEDLAPAARNLWAVVSGGLESDDAAGPLAEDLRRLGSVLAQRAQDSEALFRRLGDRWDTVRTELFGDAYALPALLSLLPDDLDAADLGCGTGALLPVLATACRTVVGIDREQAMLDVAAARVAGLPEVELRKGQLAALPLSDSSVDLAVCVLVLHHVGALEPVFAEVARVLRPDGRCLVVDICAHDREEYRASMGHRHLGFASPDLAAAAEVGGLELVRWRRLPPDPEAQGPGLFAAVLARVDQVPVGTGGRDWR